MGYIKLILFAIMLVVGIISIINYYQGKGDMKRTQASILENLTHDRVLTEKEIDSLKKLYKIKLERNTPVYSISGTVGYIVFETNGQGQKEWQIGGVIIANKSAKILAKKNIALEQFIVNDKDVNPKIEALNKELEANTITEEEATAKANIMFEKYTNNTIEFVIANPSKKEKPVYVLSYKSNDMVTPVNLLA
ncbi:MULTISPECIES: hypothetical protein [unclassified Cellulophaga]|uniref:hypothetical protein n=1 Tax=unclassified Cellulophaga TaxID=2634405 RepID=UPI0026E222BF|nr:MULTISPECIES: hypothetical protein [unclassified Cellulophaga]MDO6491704.1 hypothetical protein [Cellulophaga sp. 2_MG-2023]MDO6495641.1 hypothetical protein [Cellulophaga sp. 3_MG-2023]